MAPLNHAAGFLALKPLEIATLYVNTERRVTRDNIEPYKNLIQENRKPDLHFLYHVQFPTV